MGGEDTVQCNRKVKASVLKSGEVSIALPVEAGKSLQTRSKETWCRHLHSHDGEGASTSPLVPQSSATLT